ncbi:hypothetical protein CKJ76_15965 [Mycobacterium avium]|nr:hypothetical protein CKJ76_15965 [Mycobacterium avium]
MVVSPQRLTRWPSYVRDRHAAITYTTPRDAPLVWCSAADAGRSGATGADGSASGRKRRERSEARKVAAELSLVLNVW